MSISYLLTTQELSLLTYFCGEASLYGFDHLPALAPQEVEGVLQRLLEKHMVTCQDNRVQVDPAIHFLLRAMAAPKLLVDGGGQRRCYVTPAVGILLEPDRRLRGDNFRLTPCETAAELVDALLQGDNLNQSESDTELSVVYGQGSAGKAVGPQEILGQIQQIYEMG